MENTVVEEKKKNLPWFITKIVLNVIFYIVIVILLLFSIMNINSGGKNQGFPNIFGKGFLSVQSDSMTRINSMDDIEGYKDYSIQTFKKGDLLFVDVVDGNKVNQLRVGDIITYRDDSLNALNSHRIVYATYIDAEEVTYYVSYKGVYVMNNNAYEEYNGGLPNDVTTLSINTQGDLSASTTGIFDPTDATKAAINQSLLNSAVDTFTSANFSVIKGVTTGISIGSGAILENVQNNWVFYFIIPVLIFLLIEIFLVIKNVMELKGHKNKGSLEEQKEAIRLELEAEKEKMRQQILAELKAENPTVVTDNSSDDSDSALKDETTVVQNTIIDTNALTEEVTQEENDVIEETINDASPLNVEETESEVEDIAVEVTPEEKTSVEETANNEEEKIVVEEKPVVKKAPTKKAATAKETTAKTPTKKATTASKTTTAKSTTTKKATATTKTAGAKTTTKKATATTKKPVTKTVKKDDVKTNKEESE